jgi:hypothetical protein
MEILTLEQYLDKHCSSGKVRANKAEFARRVGCHTQDVNRMIGAGYFMLGPVLCKPTRYRDSQSDDDFRAPVPGLPQAKK